MSRRRLDNGARSTTNQRGQATVEFALLLPLLLSLLVVVVQVGLVVTNQLVLTEAVANGARLAVREPDHDAIRSAVRNTGGLEPDRLTVNVTTSGRYVTVGGSYRVRLSVPMLDLGTTLTLRNSLTVRTEPSE